MKLSSPQRSSHRDLAAEEELRAWGHDFNARSMLANNQGESAAPLHPAREGGWRRPDAGTSTSYGLLIHRYDSNPCRGHDRKP